MINFILGGRKGEGNKTEKTEKGKRSEFSAGTCCASTRGGPQPDGSEPPSSEQSRARGRGCRESPTRTGARPQLNFLPRRPGLRADTQPDGRTHTRRGRRPGPGQARGLGAPSPHPASRGSRAPSPPPRSAPQLPHTHRPPTPSRAPARSPRACRSRPARPGQRRSSSRRAAGLAG